MVVGAGRSGDRRSDPGRRVLVFGVSRGGIAFDLRSSLVNFAMRVSGSTCKVKGGVNDYVAVKVKGGVNDYVAVKVKGGVNVDVKVHRAASCASVALERRARTAQVGVRA